ncbi:MAG: hypothetical protein D6759_11125 [Chloroflexi bacterium]|nr:MAG: hypothetical protein D6759_11125 [Chloroflexota bacterium]
MSANPQKTATRASHERLLSMLDELPPASQAVVERFVEFLHEQARRGRPVVVTPEGEEKPPYLYPTVPVPASSLDGLIGVMPPVGGDALADTEALYDEA